MNEPSYVNLELEARSPQSVYHLLTALVIPRPIAWISSLNPDGGANLAPFSFFNCICADPPLLLVSFARRDGLPKDTVRNLRERPEFVVNLPNLAQARDVFASAADLPYGESELTALGLRTLPSVRVAAPRVAGTHTQLECRVERWLELGNGPVDLLIGRILAAHVREDALDEHGRPRPELLDPLARLGGGQFAGLDEPFKVDHAGT
jgi:flavin reductase (DIM6/NTAB) family NADH-FMN oxidoreductase RutF